MTISSEWDLLERIRRAVGVPPEGASRDIVTGIGDDCAVYRISPGRFGLFSTDISIESVHFITDMTSAADIGYRSMIGNISDISAMGGECRLAMVALGLPEKTGEEFVVELYRGMKEAASMAGLAVVGGDISRAKELVISISIYGEIAGYDPVHRNGAGEGDTIYVTGDLGDSLAGLQVLMSGTPPPDPFTVLTAKHRRPPCRSAMVKELLDTYRPTAMIDISDGLLSDLRHICSGSNTGFVLDAEAIPRSSLLMEYCAEKGLSPEELILYSGEEYELLFTSQVSARGEIGGTPVTPIGTITGSGYFLNRDGKKSPVRPDGFDHFKKR